MPVPPCIYSINHSFIHLCNQSQQNKINLAHFLSESIKKKVKSDSNMLIKIWHRLGSFLKQVFKYTQYTVLFNVIEVTKTILYKTLLSDYLIYFSSFSANPIMFNYYCA